MTGVTDRRKWQRHPCDYIAPDPAWPPVSARIPFGLVCEADHFAWQEGRRMWIDDVCRTLGLMQIGDLP